MENVLLVVQLLVAVGLVAVILLQRTAQDGGGLVGGGSTMGGLFTARGSANLLTRTTAVLATIFILNSLALGYIASSRHQSHSVLDEMTPQAPANPAPASAPSSAPSVPTPPASASAPPPASTPAPAPKQETAPAAPQVPLPQ